LHGIVIVLKPSLIPPCQRKHISGSSFSVYSWSEHFFFHTAEIAGNIDWQPLCLCHGPQELSLKDIEIPITYKRWFHLKEWSTFRVRQKESAKIYWARIVARVKFGMIISGPIILTDMVHRAKSLQNSAQMHPLPQTWSISSAADGMRVTFTQ
jgi:hypothetical protein